MKKLMTVCLILAMALTLFAGCTDKKQEGTYRIAIVQQMDHSSLDEIRQAVESRLEEIGKEKNITVEFEVFNGQNDPAILGQIGTRILEESFDGVLPIASLAAQYMVSATEGTDIPVVYAAVSDPEEAGLTDIPNVTGTSDALNVQFILDMMLKVNPEMKTVGLLYSNSEPNSQKPIREMKALLDEKGIAYLEKTGHSADEVMSAAGALVGRVDAVFTPTDNAVMNVAAAVSELFAQKQIPFYTGADSFVSAGAFASCSAGYPELGKYTADMMMDVLLTGKCPQYHVMEGSTIVYHSGTAAALGADVTVFETMTQQVVDLAGK